MNIKKSKRPIGQLQTDPHNPRSLNKEKYKKLKSSIEAFPEMLSVRPLVVADGFVVGGNMRLLALKELGYREVEVIDVSDWTKAQRDEFMIKDNLSFGDWDYDLLANEWNIDDLTEWGMDLWDTEPEEMKGLTDEDDIPEAPEEPTTKLGDVWILGKHRVMCADATNIDDIENLLQGKDIDVVWTDPPYGMNAVSKSGVLSKRYKTDILNDSDQTVAIKAFDLCKSAPTEFWFGANYYPECLPSSGCWIVWDKNNGGSDQADAELCYTNQKGVVRKFTQASEKKDRVHPTQKPVTLIEWCFERWSDNLQNEIVADPFLGSGTTLIACEKTGRVCYGMELDPKYCDVIVKRWEDFTGKKAKKA